jgi:DNA mismatch endonuclease (patch repair protein)
MPAYPRCCAAPKPSTLRCAGDAVDPKRSGRPMTSEDLAECVGPPQPLNDLVRRQMQSMPRRDTEIELALRRELHRLGLRFRVNLRALPGTPDIALTRARVAVFVDGCFWHRCPQHATSPKNNSTWWASKLDGNVERDRRKDQQLQQLGWMPLHVWEHEDPVTAAREIHKLWLERTRHSAGQTNSVSDS